MTINKDNSSWHLLDSTTTHHREELILIYTTLVRKVYQLACKPSSKDNPLSIPVPYCSINTRCMILPFNGLLTRGKEAKPIQSCWFRLYVFCILSYGYVIWMCLSLCAIDELILLNNLEEPSPMQRMCPAAACLPFWPLIQFACACWYPYLSDLLGHMDFLMINQRVFPYNLWQVTLWTVNDYKALLSALPPCSRGLWEGLCTSAVTSQPRTQFWVATNFIES